MIHGAKTKYVAFSCVYNDVGGKGYASVEDLIAIPPLSFGLLCLIRPEAVSG